jgi:hypothetical protein
MTDESLNLRACPFCGATPNIGAWAAASEVWPNATAVECSSGLDDCPVNPCADGYDREAAIAAWNRRTPQPDKAGVPDVLFDGHAVYKALAEGRAARTGPENVSDTLDAVVRLLRATPPQPGAGEDRK